MAKIPRKQVDVRMPIDVAGLLRDIGSDRNAASAAERILCEAIVYLEFDEPMPSDLRLALADALSHLADNDPLAAFRHLLPVKKRSRGGQAKESDREWLDIALAIYQAHKKDGASLQLMGDDEDSIRTSAFYAVARLLLSNAADSALLREARRLQDRWLAHLRTLPAESIQALGLPKRKAKR